VQNDPDDISKDSDNQPESFTDATDTYLNALHSVDVRLKRQIFGLNEAGIVSMEKESPTRSEGPDTDGTRAAKEKVVLDVGWLNSRSGKVGRDMEAELWAKSRTFLKSLKTANSNDHTGEENLASRDGSMGG
jgi:hypothetical protein